jgi:hypothetical protein
VACEGLKVTASLVHPGAVGVAATATAAPASFPLAETAPGQYHGHFTLDEPGDFVLRASADQATAEVPLAVAYPAIYRFTRADPDRLAALAMATGGRVLANEEQIFTAREWRLVARSLWQIWIAAALALFVAELVIRYVSGLIGWQRKRHHEQWAEAARHAA